MSYEFETELRRLVKDMTECHNLRNNLHILVMSNHINIKGSCSNELEAELTFSLQKFLSRNRVYGEVVEIAIKFDWKGFKKIEIKEVKDNKPFSISYRQQQLNIY